MTLLHLFLFHGTEILTIFGGGFVGLGIFFGMVAWALRGPARPWTVPLIYLLVGLSLSIPEIFTDNFLGFSVMFAFPWSVLLVVTSTLIDRDIGLVWFIPAIVINSVIVYLVARYQSRPF
jgi:hypothetical protein